MDRQRLIVIRWNDEGGEDSVSLLKGKGQYGGYSYVVKLNINKKCRKNSLKEKQRK